MTSVQQSVTPAEGDIQASLAKFAAAVQHHYGARLTGLYLFGSRARKEHRPDSDVDVVAILSDARVDHWKEIGILSDLSYSELVDYGVDIDCRVTSASAWNDPSIHYNPSLVKAMRRDARSIPPP